jgi:hypothetical protein
MIFGPVVKLSEQFSVQFRVAIESANKKAQPACGLNRQTFACYSSFYLCAQREPDNFNSILERSMRQPCFQSCGWRVPIEDPKENGRE